MVAMDSDKEETRKETYGAKMGLYVGMAHYVGKRLHIRPNEILDTWCVPELIVAYGHYMNEESQKAYNEWKHLDAKTRSTTPKPDEYVVKFYGVQ